MQRSLAVPALLAFGTLSLCVSAGSHALAQEPQAAPSPTAIDAELARLVGLKKTIVVVEGAEATLWAFFADGIKSTAGSSVTLKKNAPFASSKGDAPSGGMAEALGLAKKDDPQAGEKKVATKEDIAGALVGQMQNYGNRYVPFGGYWFSAPGPNQPGAPVAGVAGLLKREQPVEVLAILKVVDKK